MLLNHQLTVLLLLHKVIALDYSLMRVMEKLAFILMIMTLMMMTTIMMKRNYGRPAVQSMMKTIILMKAWYDQCVQYSDEW